MNTEITADMLARLSKSKFRSSFRLKAADIDYARAKGRDVIESHARDLLLKRLAPAQPRNDGKQTPYRGHPVFIAQHATATCCRGCLEKWHHIERGHALSVDELNYAVNIVMAWLDNQVDGEWSHK